MKRRSRSDLRVTGGVYRGRKVRCPPGIIRPTMDRIRESLFAILGDLHSVSFLDLFCGSGIVGIEAASRGAEPVTLVESDRLKRQTIRANISFIESAVTLEIMTSERFVAHSESTYEVIYIDPPFSYPGKLKLLQSIERSSILSPSGTETVGWAVASDIGRALSPPVAAAAAAPPACGSAGESSARSRATTGMVGRPSASSGTLICRRRTSCSRCRRCSYRLRARLCSSSSRPVTLKAA